MRTIKILGIILALCAAAFLVNGFMAGNRYNAAMKRCGEQHRANLKLGYREDDRWWKELEACMDRAQQIHHEETWGF